MPVDIEALKGAGIPIYIIIILILLVSISTFTKQMSELKGVWAPLGTFARAWRNRQISALNRSDVYNRTIETVAERRFGTRLDDLETDLSRVRNELRAAREEHKKDQLRWREERDQLVAQHKRELEKASKETRMYAEYAAEVSRINREQVLSLAAIGVEMPPPPVPSFQDWHRALRHERGEE